MQDETSRIEDALLSETSIRAVLRAFGDAKSATFENMLEPLLKVCDLFCWLQPRACSFTDVDRRSPQIMRLSSVLCARFGESPSFLRRLTERLSSHPKAVVRLNLLRLLKLLQDASVHHSMRSVAKQAGLAQLVEKLAGDDPSLLVKNFAKDLAEDFERGQISKGESNADFTGPTKPSLPSLAGSARQTKGTTSKGKGHAKALSLKDGTSPKMPADSQPAQNPTRRTLDFSLPISEPVVSPRQHRQVGAAGLLSPLLAISPRIRMKSRPQSPANLSDTDPGQKSSGVTASAPLRSASDPSGHSSPGQALPALSGRSSVQHSTRRVENGLPLPQRRISIRAKTSPPR